MQLPTPLTRHSRPTTAGHLPADTGLTLDDLKAVTRAFGGIFTVDDMFDMALRAKRA